MGHPVLLEKVHASVPDSSVLHEDNKPKQPTQPKKKNNKKTTTKKKPRKPCKKLFPQFKKISVIHTTKIKGM